MIRWPAVLVAAATLTFAEASRAGDDDVRERASRSFSEAKAAFAQRSYTAAATAFEEAARLVPHPATWLDAAAAWELAGDPARAAEDCDRAITTAGADAHGADAAKRLEKLLPKIATIEVRARTSSLVRVDGGDPMVVPGRRRVIPGHHRLVITDPKTGEERALELDLAAGATRDVDIEPEPSPAPPIEPRREAPPRGARREGEREEPARHAFDTAPPAGSWIGFGAAGIATGIAVGFGVVTLDAKHDFESQPTRDGLDAFKRDRAITNTVLATAIVAAAVGAAIWLWAPRPLRPASF